MCVHAILGMFRGENATQRRRLSLPVKWCLVAHNHGGKPLERKDPAEVDSQRQLEVHRDTSPYSWLTSDVLFVSLI